MWQLKGTARLAAFQENTTREGDTIRMLNVFAGGDVIPVYVGPEISDEALATLRKLDYDTLPAYEMMLGVSNRRSGGKGVRLLALVKPA